MAKKNNDVDKEQKRKALLKAIDDLKAQDPTLTDEDIETLVKAVDEIVEVESKRSKKLFRLIISFLIKYVLMYVSLLIVMSLFIGHFSIDRINIFLVTAIISLPFTMLHSSHIFGVRYWDKSFLPKFVVALASFIVAVCLLNQYQYRVFMFTSEWIIILILASLLYMVLDFYLASRIDLY